MCCQELQDTTAISFLSIKFNCFLQINYSLNKAARMSSIAAIASRLRPSLKVMGLSQTRIGAIRNAAHFTYFPDTVSEAQGE